MADFTSLATSYVLADGEDEQKQLATKAAEAIKNSPRKSAAVLNWAQSINQWMPKGNDVDDDGDVIIRAKALGFLASTLEQLDKDVLRAQQVEHLITFFGAMFTIDHKAGILAAATALRCLCDMSYFKPSMAVAVLGYITKLGDDFRLQTTPTRRAIYDLISRLVGDTAVLRELQLVHGAQCGFATDLLHVCKHERDPTNLLQWFSILQLLLERYDPLSPEVAEEIFKAFSDYFPISMRSSATPIGITVDDLKSALRACFSACFLAAGTIVDFLLQKLDQGDALTVSVKVDILRTIYACVQTFPQPAKSVVPHTSRLWNSLKYEVRHGEVPESMEGTLLVIKAISARLNGQPLEKGEAPSSASLKDFVESVLADCINDLSNPTYAKQAGQLLNSVLQGGQRSFNLAISPVLTAVKQNLQQSQTETHTRDLLGFLSDVLHTRQTLVDAERESTADSDTTTTTEFHGHDMAILGLLDSIYLNIWDDGEEATSSQYQDPTVQTEVLKGLGALVVQRGPSSGSETGPLLLTSDQCLKVFKILTSTVAADSDFSHEAMITLQKATSVYPAGFQYLVDHTVASISEPPPTSINLAKLRDTLSRVAFVGCATIPPKSDSNRLRHFSTLRQSLLTALFKLLDNKAPFPVSNIVLSGIYAAILNLRSAFEEQGVLPSRTKKANTNSTADAEGDLLHVFQDYLKESVSTVQKLYLRATSQSTDGLELSTDFEFAYGSTSALEDQDVYLHQLSNLATFVVRDLDADQQKESKLYEAPFTLFHSGYVGKTIFHKQQGGRPDVLSLGILKGLWPAVLASLADVSISPLRLLEDLDVLDTLPLRTRIVRNNIATVISNKYSASANSHTGNQDEWKKTIDAVKAKLDVTPGSTKATLTPNQFARLVAIATGAFARLDKDSKELAALLAFAPAKLATADSSRGEQMARLLSLLVSSGTGSLSVDDHAVVKSIYKQWVYGQTVKALLPLAFPARKTSDAPDATADAAAKRESTIHTIAILALVRHIPFSVYEYDVDALVRILVTAATTLPSWTEVAYSLRVLSVILENRPDAVQGHLKTLVDGSVEVFGAVTAEATAIPGSTTKSKKNSRRGLPPPACRKQALHLVGRFPSQFEERLLLTYEPRLARALAAACGDPVREIREVAQLARESWSKIES